MIDGQYQFDSMRFAELVSKYTAIPTKNIDNFLANNPVSQLLPQANNICKTDTQKKKLNVLFEFKNLYDTMRTAESKKDYRIVSSEDAKDYITKLFADKKDKEYFYAICLDNGYRVIKAAMINAGTVNETHIYPRKIVEEALFCNANSIILAHNHPGGTQYPSNQDIEVTHRLMRALKEISIKVVDHIVAADGKGYSMAENGYIGGNSLGEPAAPYRMDSVKEPAAGKKQAPVKKPSILQHIKQTQKNQRMAQDKIQNKGMAKRKNKSDIDIS